MLARIHDRDIFYRTLGKGLPLMVMHGGMGFDHSYFRPWLDPLAEKMQLIYYDHRGNGQSTRLDDFDGIDHRMWADDADALRKHLGHEKIVLLGHSAGGFVALEYALRYGKHLSGLVLCCTTPAMDYPEVIMANAKAKATPEQLPVVAEMFTTPLASNEQFHGGIEMLLPLYFKQYNPKTGSQIANAIHYNYHAINYSLSTWFPVVNFLSALQEITVPTLIIGGTEDWIMPPAQGAERLHASIPGSDLAIFGNSGHFPFVEEQGAFNKIIADWVGGLK